MFVFNCTRRYFTRMTNGSWYVITSHRLSNNCPQQSSGDIRAKHKLTSNLCLILSDVLLYPSAQLSPKISPLPEKCTTHHLREKLQFIFVSSIQISGDSVCLCYTMGGGQTMRTAGKGNCWQAGFEIILRHHMLSIPLQTTAVTYTALTNVMARTS